MAADLFMLSRCAISTTILVRFYTWNPPAISLGCMQHPRNVLDLDALARDGITWIRRPTGGRAVLHRGDITYSIAFPINAAGMGNTITDSYAVVSRCLRAGLLDAGITTSTHDTVIDPALARREIKLPCFSAPNRDEIMIEGRKIVGSAQKRTDSAVLQHGSIPITDDHLDLPRYLALSPDQRRIQRQALERKATSISRIRPGLDSRALAESLSRGFGRSLAVSTIIENWTGEEYDAITESARSDQFHAAWLSVT